ncbi:putative polysaccharide biosynthesis protein [Peribacillus frigoritolerans]|uniref:putative polysaccharide biosynthesis protein n=1 Tax=Peribacillus frigoritolerans TaxID=450367 RepID=UPI00105A0048|nr:polysaccharide biosynthesis protein [Peribacillus frigoritolerans]TDL76435.1 polysaccharide biosynthesis protein [Peribacillus frigoritolerans]
MSNKLLRGTLVLTLGTYISRLLGMIYIIPFYALVGKDGGALYQIGYAQYAVFLGIATMGFPQAVSKFVSKYNSIGDYATSRKMFRVGISVMFGTGVLAFAILYFLAPFLAESSLGQRELGNTTIDDAVLVIRMVSLALIVVPIMSLIRGFFQGHQSMGPTAVSQVIEQIVRIAFLLASTYLVLKVFNGTLVTAVGYSTFAAFVGAIGGLLVLFVYWQKRKHTLDALRENAVASADMPAGRMFKELFSYAGPFVFVGLAIPLYTYIDTNTFNKAMVAGGFEKISTDIFSIVTLYLPKLVMIPVSLATAFGLTLVPTITKSFTNKNMTLVNRQIDQAFQIIIFLTLPAIVGLVILAEPAYMVFYENDPDGPGLLRWFAPVALLFSFFTVTAAVLQGINKQKLAVISLAFGLIIKLAVNAPLIEAYQGLGSILATALGFGASIIYSFAMIHRHAGYSFKLLFKRTVFIAILTAFMALVVSVSQSILSIFIDYADGKMQSVIILLISIGLGAAAYLYAAHRSHLLEKLLGNRFSFLNRKKKAAE